MPEHPVHRQGADAWMDVGRSRVLIRDIGDGPPVLLINGLGSHTTMWGPIERQWSDLRLVSFDAPGVGRSATRVPPPSIPGIADVAVRLLDHLRLQRVDVLGYSLGGAVAQTLAVRAPERVRRLVLVATLPGWGCVPGRWSSLIHVYNPWRYFSGRYYSRTIGTMAGGQARNPDFAARHSAERLATRPNILGYYAQIAALSSWSSLSWLHRITAPTLVVTGDDDPLQPMANSAMLARRIPEARLSVHPEEGHLLLFDDHSPALPCIHEFLAAPAIDCSTTWQQARVVDADLEQELISAAPAGLFPWGLASATYRACRRPPADA